MHLRDTGEVNRRKHLYIFKFTLNSWIPDDGYRDVNLILYLLESRDTF